MGLTLRITTSWLYNKLDRSLASSRTSIFRAGFIVVITCFIACLFLLSVFSLFTIISNLSVGNHYEPFIHEPREDLLKHFAGSRDCEITQADIYEVPWPISPKVSPFCKNRATLLEAMSGGGRHGFDEPYVGKGCTNRWFPTPEICMIIERFNTIIFIGDDLAQSIYAAFNILLREDLAFGSLKRGIMTDEDRLKCKCDNQFTNSECRGYAIKNIDEGKKEEASYRKGNPYLCERIPHAYLPVNGVPASAASQDLFRDLMSSKPNPWQPSPMIFSFGQGSAFDVPTTIRALDEWTGLAAAAERNIPMLFLGSPAFGVNKSSGTAFENGNFAVWQYLKEISPIAKEKHFDVLSLYNLTLQASSTDGEHFGTKVALVEAMMIINWLSKLETS